MKARDVENYFNTHGRSALIALAVLLMTVTSGFFMGMRQTRNFSDQTRDLRDRQSASGPETVVPGEIQPAASYTELATAQLQPNAAWVNVLSNLPTADEIRTPVAALTEREQSDALATRASRRAYDGAPPVVPHPIDQRSVSTCITCHGITGSQPVIAGKSPPRMSHAYMTNCTQCHVTAKGFGEGFTDSELMLGLGVVENAFIGRPSSGPGSRAYPTAPPTIPHHTSMRENCFSCHGAGRANAITTSHPDRQSCTQCHASSAARDGRSLDLQGLLTPVKFPVDLSPPPPPPKRNPKPPQESLPETQDSFGDASAGAPASRDSPPTVAKPDRGPFEDPKAKPKPDAAPEGKPEPTPDPKSKVEPEKKKSEAPPAHPEIESGINPDEAGPQPPEPVLTTTKP